MINHGLGYSIVLKLHLVIERICDLFLIEIKVNEILLPQFIRDFDIMHVCIIDEPTEENTQKHLRGEKIILQFGKSIQCAKV